MLRHSDIPAGLRRLRPGCVRGATPALVLGLLLAASPAACMGLRTGDAPYENPPPGPVQAVEGGGSDTPEYVPGQVLVKFRTTLAPATRAALLAEAGTRVLSPVGGTGAWLVAITDGSSVPEAIARLQALPQVEYAEPNAISRIPEQPTPPQRMR